MTGDPPARMRIAIVAQDRAGRASLARSIETDLAARVVAVTDTLEEIAGRQGPEGIDLLFLEVSSPRDDCLRLASELVANSNTPVVFVAREPSVAATAFDWGASDFLLRNASTRRVQEAITRGRMRLERDGERPASPALVLRSFGQHMIVKVGDVTWIEAARYYSRVHVPDSAITVRRSITSFAQELRERGFLRVHRSALVNVSKVTAVSSLRYGDALLTLADGAEVRASRSYREPLFARLGLRGP